MLHLRELREKRGLSQADIARALGISRQSYNFYENGKGCNLCSKNFYYFCRSWMWNKEKLFWSI